MATELARPADGSINASLTAPQLVVEGETLHIAATGLKAHSRAHLRYGDDEDAIHVTDDFGAARWTIDGLTPGWHEFTLESHGEVAATVSVAVEPRPVY